ncbi:hypothetical protein [Acidithiobacillus ferrivorans]|uniref:Uncharacterized protein n=1 Tax=Acidithiobacillus ferrivorans TaxID=160808 RepID=A0A7T5BIV7_9PROT|nr:hypothetical protein [Acidithiobacillus ferrivorans]QQD74020.1 hypothetical protein H2515_07330 [Acidithiobacillus ferrivorans]
MATSLKPQSIEAGWMTRWWHDSLLLLRGAPASFVMLYLVLLLLNVAWQPLILSIPIACGVMAIIFAVAMAVHQGRTQLIDVGRSIRDVPWWPLSRLILEIALLVMALLMLMLLFRHYLAGILSHDHISSAATLHNVRSPEWQNLPEWLRSLITNGLGTAQTMLSNAFLLLSVGVIVAGITTRAYLALLAGIQAVLVNVRVWLVFLLASLLLQGGITFLSARLHTFGAALLVSILGVALLLLVGLYGWCFVREAFGLPGAQMAKRVVVAVWRSTRA